VKWAKWSTGLAFVAPLVVGQATACSGSTGSLVDGGAADSAGSSSGASSGGGDASSDGTGGSSGSSGSSSGTPPPINNDASVDDLCHSETRTGQCAMCCSSNHSGGSVNYNMEIFNCACGTGAPCQTQCATTYCTLQRISPAVGSTCDVCLAAAIGTGGACVSQVNTKCQGDPGCPEYVSCVAGCP
jgi:hypothetical protein